MTKDIFQKVNLSVALHWNAWKRISEFSLVYKFCPGIGNQQFLKNLHIPTVYNHLTCYVTVNFIFVFLLSVSEQQSMIFFLENLTDT